MTHAAVRSPSAPGSTASPQRSRAPQPAPIARLDGERIAAGASAITANVVVLMLMLVPVAAPQLIPRMIAQTEVQWVPREPPKLIEPVPVPVTPQAPSVQAQTPPTRARPVAPSVMMPTAEPGDIATTAEPSLPEIADRGEQTDSLARTQAGVQLQYASASPPAYPRDALRQGLGGTVLLQVLVDTDGKPLQVDVVRSSGHRSLDRAAQRHVLARWTFRPAVEDGRPVQAIGLVPVEFAPR